MRILIASRYLPWPMNSGGNAAQFSTLKCLSQDHEFTLVCPVYSENQECSARHLARELPEVIIRSVWCGPEPSANLNIKEIEPLVIRLLRNFARLARGPVRQTSRLTQTIVPQAETPYEPLIFLPRPYLETLATELTKGIELVQVEFAEMLSLGPWLPAGIPKLFVHHQIHFMYAQRFMATSGAGAFNRYVTEFVRCRELACLRSFDSVVTFSDADRQYLEDQSALPPIFTSPFPVPADVGFVTAPSQHLTGNFTFLGSEDHFPNRDALKWVLDQIWPLIIKALPTTKLSIIGEWSDQWKMRAAAFGSSVEFPGFVPDLGEVLQGGILLVPLRIGSGIRTKILAALAQGVPCVATTIAAEGLQLEQMGGVLLADDETTFVNAALRLARDPAVWQSCAVEGLRSVKKTYSPEAVRTKRNAVYDQVIALHRSKTIR